MPRNLLTVAVVILGTWWTGTCRGQSTFTPLAQMAGIVEPPVGVVPVNFGDVVSGRAHQYICNQLPGPSSFAYRTTDFVANIPLPVPPDAVASKAVATAAIGFPVVGTISINSGVGSLTYACIWQDENSYTLLTTALGQNQQAVGISRDGQRWVARSMTPERSAVIDNHGIVIVTPHQFEQDENTSVRVTAISPDGSVIAGIYGGPTGTPFVQHQGGLAESTRLPMVCSFISNDGNVLVGSSQVGLRGPAIPYRISTTFVKAMTPDGRVVVGSGSFASPKWPGLQASVWTQSRGTVPIGLELMRLGINRQGWTLQEALWVSDDGSDIAGTGIDSSGVQGWWLVHIDKGICSADIAQEGGVSGGDGKRDNNDLIVFVDRFFSGDLRADLGSAGAARGPDGVFDNNDFCVFLDLFFSGEP